MFQAATPGLEARLATGRPIAGYNGFDPTGPSLHIGHLVPIFGLLQLQRHGGRPVALVGGGTGMIGDPSGRSAERNLLDEAALADNVVRIRGQLEGLLGGDDGGSLFLDNLDWLGGYRLVEFLRDVGKHFTLSYMLEKDSVQVRLARGLSFTEFSYMLLQAADFQHLFRVHGVELQMGGADQWGNITAGLELIRRSGAGGVADDGPAEPAHGLAYPLLLSPSGAKFGKSEGGQSVWLDPAMTSPFAFYQHWLNTDDRDIGTYLRWFSLLPQEEILALDEQVLSRPEQRAAQRRLAGDLTRRVHGPAAAADAGRISEAAFGGGPITDPAVLETLHRAGTGLVFEPAMLAAGLAALLAEAGVVGSRGEARRLIAGGGLRVNGQRIGATDTAVPEPIAGEWLDIQIGKRRREVLRRAP